MDKWNFPHPKLLSILFLFSVCVALYNNATITYVSELYAVPAGFMNLYIYAPYYIGIRYNNDPRLLNIIAWFGPCFVHPECSRHSIFIVKNLMQCAGHRNGVHQQQTYTCIHQYLPVKTRNMMSRYALTLSIFYIKCTHSNYACEPEYKFCVAQRKHILSVLNIVELSNYTHTHTYTLRSWIVSIFLTFSNAGRSRAETNMLPTRKITIWSTRKSELWNKLLSTATAQSLN